MATECNSDTQGYSTLMRQTFKKTLFTGRIIDFRFCRFSVLLCLSRHAKGSCQYSCDASSRHLGESLQRIRIVHNFANCTKVKKMVIYIYSLFHVWGSHFIWRCVCTFIFRLPAPFLIIWVDLHETCKQIAPRTDVQTSIIISQRQSLNLPLTYFIWKELSSFMQYLFFFTFSYKLTM